VAPAHCLRVADWLGGLTSDGGADFVDLSFNALPWRVAREVRARGGEKGAQRRGKSCVSRVSKVVALNCADGVEDTRALRVVFGGVARARRMRGGGSGG
jgi:hypothetical protein